jgi:sec-independent protein translocase protein TatC
MPIDQDPIVDESAEKDMTFLDHLEELRWHVIRSLAAVVIFTIVAFILAPWIFDNIIFGPARVTFPTFRWLCSLGQVFGTEGLCIEEFQFKLQSRYMTGQFTMHIMSSFVIGLIIAFPYVVFEIWRFIRPGLYNTEKKYSKGAVAAISFLFFTGVLFGYFIMAPLMVYFLANYRISDIISNEFDITSYVSTIVGMVFGSGMLFQLPVVIYFLTRVGIVTPAFLRQYRKHSIVGIMILAAILTPPDPLSQTMIAIPLYLLFEISILISSRVYKQKLKEEEAEQLKDKQTYG